MKPKMIGIGKCGSRMAYDFFAYISDLPPSYSIKTKLYDRNLKRVILTAPGIRQLHEKYRKAEYSLRTKWHELFGSFKLYETPALITIDSDKDNNEIINLIEYLKKDEHSIGTDGQGNTAQDGQVSTTGLKIIFPGRSMGLHDHVGGCDFHIVSEHVALDWPPDEAPDYLYSSEESEILVAAFSIGGGTGGGAAPVILSRCKTTAQAAKKKPHCMGMGVLPDSDEQYLEMPSIASMATVEKYNTGRFFTSFYSKRNFGSLDYLIDSLWLVSNDSLLPFDNKYFPSDRVPPEKNLSTINFYMASALSTICNASSKQTKSEPNFDAFEMTNRLGGNPFVSGFSFEIPDPSTDDSIYYMTVQKLFYMALSYPSILPNREMVGLSIPLRQSEYRQIEYLLGGEPLRSDKDFLERYANYSMRNAPLEFRTVQHAVLLYGQSERSQYSSRKNTIAADMLEKIFPNSNPSPYYFTHPGKADIMLIMLVNPLIRMVQNSIYYYTAASWLRPEVDNFQEIFDDVIINAEFDSSPIAHIIEEEERITSDIHGPGTIEFLAKNGLISKVTKKNVLETFERLHSIFHYKKVPKKISRI